MLVGGVRCRSNVASVVLLLIVCGIGRARCRMMKHAAARLGEGHDKDKHRCSVYFNACWSGTAWNATSQAMDCGSSTSLNSRFFCERTLCNAWMRVHCSPDPKKRQSTCNDVSRMCSMVTEHRKNLAADLNRNISTVNLLSLARDGSEEKVWMSKRTDDKRMSGFMGDRRQSPPEAVWLSKNTSKEQIRSLIAVQRSSEAQNLTFIHIPKNAGSAVEEAGAKFGYHWGMHADFSRVHMRDGFECHRYHVPPALLEQSIKFDTTNERSFAIVRNPYQRVLSEYRYLLSVEWGEVWDPSLREGKECTQKGFNDWLERTLTRVLQGERYINDCHMLPQMEYIEGYDKRYAKWEHGEVLKWEELPDSFNKLMEVWGMEPRLDPDEFVNGHKKMCPELEAGDLWDRPKALMNLVYYQDFKQFGYKMK